MIYVNSLIHKVVVTNIVRDQQKLIVADKGILTEDDWPVHYKSQKNFSNGQSGVQGRDYCKLLESSPAFMNPTCVQQLCNQLKLPNHASLLFSIVQNEKEMAKNLRKEQSAKWAQKHVIEGVEHLKKENNVQAHQCLNMALQIDRDNIEALVARGALYFNNQGYLKALEDFDR